MPIDIGKGSELVKINQSIAVLNAYAKQFTTVIADNNVYTLDLSNGINFMITVSDAEAKSIVFANVPTDSGILLPVTVLLVYTSAATIIHPIGIVWQNGIAPTFTTGNKYTLMYSSWDNGTTWQGSAAGAWAV